MKTWRRFLAAFVTIAMLVPMTAIGEDTEAILDALIVPESQGAVIESTEPEASSDSEGLGAEPQTDDAVEDDASEEPTAEDATDPAQDDAVQSEQVEIAVNEVALELSTDGTENAEGPIVHFYEKTVNPASKSPTFTISSVDTIRLRVSGATSATWKPAKAGYVTMTTGSDADGLYTDFKAEKEIKKLKLTAALTGSSKKKATVTLVIQNPYEPTSIAFSGMPEYIAAGGTLDLNKYIVMEPSYAKTTLTWKCSGAGKVDKAGLLKTTKAGNAKITVTTKNKLKYNYTLKVMANKVQYPYGKPSGSAFAEVAGGWTLWPVSIDVDKKGGVLCQFNLVNGTGDKVTQIKNLTLSIAAGTRDNIIAEGKNLTVKASVSKGKSKALKITLKPNEKFGTVFMPEYYKTKKLFLNINQGETKLVSKTSSYDFIYTPKFPAPRNVESIQLNQYDATMRIGEELTLIASVQPVDAENTEVIWSTDNESVATVENGKVTAVGIGSAVITAKAADGSGITKTCVVTVVRDPILVTNIIFDPDEIEMVEGTTLPLVHTVLPSDADNLALEWASDKTDVVTVADGVVTAVARGTAKITATAKDGSGVMANCTVTVLKATNPVTSVTFDRNEAELTVGETLTLVATVLPSDADDLSLEWTSDNTDVATIANGVVTAKAIGMAKITATAKSGKKAECTITVVNPSNPVTSVTFDRDEAELTVGQSLTLVATVLPADADNPALEWASDKTDTATVADGVVTAVAPGTAKITATAKDGSGKKAECTITVVNPSKPVTSVTFDRNEAELTVGQSLTLVATVLPTDADNPALEWASDKTDTATVDDGVVTAVAPGTAKITATAKDGSGKKAECVVTVVKATESNYIIVNGVITKYNGKGGAIMLPSEDASGNSVLVVGERAFADNPSITSVTIPDSVTSIGSEAFYACESLISVSIPDSVESIGAYAFDGCNTSLKIIAPEGSFAWQWAKNQGYIDDDRYLSSPLEDFIIENGVVTQYVGHGGDVAIPRKDINGKSVTSIGMRAFYDCRSLTSITIPEGVTSIDVRAFEECKNLMSITMPEGMLSSVCFQVRKRRIYGTFG